MSYHSDNIRYYRSRRILLVGLGGVGSRIVDRVMGMVPPEYQPYTQAISIDTDVNEIMDLSNIPIKNRIRIGEGVTVGGYTRSHPEINEWMLDGKQMDLVRGRNTKNGAGQIRMLGRFALHVSDAEESFVDRIAKVLDDLDQSAPGEPFDSGLFVMIVSSVAGGTGAGTVLQVPIYLAEAIKSSYSEDDVEFECAMVMPNTFKTVLSPRN